LQQQVQDLNAEIQACVKAPGPQGVPGPQGKKGNAAEITPEHLQKIKTEIAALVLAQMQANPEPFRGLPGKDGRDGSDGKSIVLGDLTDADIDALAKRLPPIYPQWLHPVNGSVIDEIKSGVRLGEKLKLRLDRKIVNAADSGPE